MSSNNFKEVGAATLIFPIKNINKANLGSKEIVPYKQKNYISLSVQYIKINS